VSAGLPGLGLGGLFFIVSALIAPAVELARTLRGRSSSAAWRQVWRQLAIALTMIIAVDLSLRGAYLVAAAVGFDAPEAGGITVLPLAPLALALGILAALLAAAKGAQLACGRPVGPDPLAPVAFSPMHGAEHPHRSNRRSAHGEDQHERGQIAGAHAVGVRSRERDGRAGRPPDRPVRRRGADHDGRA
jgi:hypothetical protein